MTKSTRLSSFSWTKTELMDNICIKRILLPICVILSILVFNVACDNNNETQLDSHRERLLHSYHNLEIKNLAENSNITGLLQYLGLYHAIYHVVDSNELVRVNECSTPPSAIDDFPGTIFPEESLLKGAVIFHLVAAIYFLTLLAIVCSNYFIPSVECICEDLHLSTDVAAATFMATATTMPEFFTNTISTFVTDSDLGIGAIIGSMLFNTLGVAGCAALASSKVIPIDWWSISRDSLLFAIHVSLLVAFAFDGVIIFSEAMVFVILYFVYFTIMFQNKRISKYVKPFLERNICCFKKRVYEIDQVREVTSNVENGCPIHVKEAPNFDDNYNNLEHYQVQKSNGFVNAAYATTEDDTLGKVQEPTMINGGKPLNGNVSITDTTETNIIEDEDEELTLWKVPKGGKFWVVWWVYTWPIRLFCTCLIPNPKTYRKLYPLTFIMCMLVLAGNSFMVVWMVTVIGFTFKIPEAVMGLTFLAAGGCLPEAFSAVIMARKGDGALGIANSLGSNSLAVLFSLGFPWFLRIVVDLSKGNPAHITLYNNGLEFTILLLLLALLALYLIISCSGFRLSRRIGFALITIYSIFVTVGILMNMGIIFSFVGPNEGEC